MNLQLKTFLILLNENKLKYFIDSGTLLGLIRESDILKNDQDIDIGIHYSELNKFIALIDRIQLLGYKTRYELYNNFPSKYKFYPTNKNMIRIDFNIYKEKSNKYLWCPVTYFSKPKNTFFKLYQKIIKFFWRRIFNSIETNKFPYNTIKKSYTWIIPIEYYNNIIYNKKFQCYMFRDYKSYLKYRYNTWEVQNKNWELFRDDGGIRNESPEKIID